MTGCVDAAERDPCGRPDVLHDERVSCSWPDEADDDEDDVGDSGDVHDEDEPDPPPDVFVPCEPDEKPRGATEPGTT